MPHPAIAGQWWIDRGFRLAAARPSKQDMLVVYARSVVTFVDILGFADLVRNETAEEVEERLEAMGETAARPVGNEGHLTTVVSFSDSVIRARPVNPETIYDALMHEIQDLATAQWTLLEFGMLIRGGTTVGNVSVGEGRVFGPAFVQAYRLESSLAVSPRIVIDPGVIEAIRGHLRGAGSTRTKTELIAGLRDHVRLGDDGVWFVDYINSVNIMAGREFVRERLPDVREFIVTSAQGFADRPLILPKYLWQIRYYNQSVTRLFPGEKHLKIRATDVPASDEFLKPKRLRKPSLTH